MKILLTLILCSGLSQECIPGYEWPVEFDSYYECLQAGNIQAYNKMEAIGSEQVNEFILYVKFDCSVSEKLNT
mgnify:CR=1 FL=1